MTCCLKSRTILCNFLTDRWLNCFMVCTRLYHSKTLLIGLVKPSVINITLVPAAVRRTQVHSIIRFSRSFYCSFYKSNMVDSTLVDSVLDSSEVCANVNGNGNLQQQDLLQPREIQIPVPWGHLSGRLESSSYLL